MTTAAAIDRLVHHSVIIELNVPSCRPILARLRPALEVVRRRVLPKSLLGTRSTDGRP